MKKLLLLALLVILSGCRTKHITITKEEIKAKMEYLASDELGGRETGSPGLEKAAIYIEDFFKQNEIKPFFETYRDSFKLDDIDGYNIVGVIEGNDPELKNEYVILGGHYDHIGTAKEVDGDIIANGANDDASGTIAAMELGRYFATTGTNKRSVLITLYDAEEKGLKGAAHLAKRIKSIGTDIYTMTNFEMIGVPRAEEETMAYLTGYKRSNLAEVLNGYAEEEIVGLFERASQFGLFRRSDNFPFFNELHIPAHAISTFDFTNFEYYHHVDDEADQMDYEHMAKFINKMIPAYKGMINAPTREVVLSNE